MAFRSTVRDAARRAFTGIARGILKRANDKTLMQESQFEMLAGEEIDAAEHPQNYGFTHVPHAEDAWPAMQKQGKIAEVFVGFASGNRSHPIVFVIDDRRYRICGLQDGELMMHDEQGQQIHITRSGVYISIPHDKLLEARVMKKKAGKPDEPMKEIQVGKEIIASDHFDSKTQTRKHNQKDEEGNVTTIEDKIMDGDEVVTHMKMDKEGVIWTGKDFLFNCENFTVNAKKDVTMLGENYLEAFSKSIYMVSISITTDGPTYLDTGGPNVLAGGGFAVQVYARV